MYVYTCNRSQLYAYGEKIIGRGQKRKMSPTVAASTAKQAEQLRIDGNSYFNKNRFAAAIDAYTEVFLDLRV